MFLIFERFKNINLQINKIQVLLSFFDYYDNHFLESNFEIENYVLKFTVFFVNKLKDQKMIRRLHH